jgi:hypothetical protein
MSPRSLICWSAAAGLILVLMVSGWQATTGAPPSQMEESTEQLKAGEKVGMCFNMKEIEGWYNCLCTSCNTWFIAEWPKNCPACGSGSVTCHER